MRQMLMSTRKVQHHLVAMLQTDKPVNPQSVAVGSGVAVGVALYGGAMDTCWHVGIASGDSATSEQVHLRQLLETCRK